MCSCIFPAAEQCIRHCRDPFTFAPSHLLGSFVHVLLVTLARSSPPLPRRQATNQLSLIARVQTTCHPQACMLAQEKCQQHANSTSPSPVSDPNLGPAAVVVGLKLFHLRARSQSNHPMLGNLGEDSRLLMQPEVGDYEVGIHHQKYLGASQCSAVCSPVFG